LIHYSMNNGLDEVLVIASFAS